MANNAISYEEIRKTQIAERDNNSLQKISEDFFEKVKEYISEKKKIIDENKEKDNVFAKTIVEKNEQELKNVKKILNDICVRRYYKIVMQAMNNIFSRVHDTENMLPEEEKFYYELIEKLKNKIEDFNKKFEKEEQILKIGKDKLKFVRIVESVPSFIWRDGKTYGPFEKEDLVNLPEELGEILINEKKATEIIIGDENNENAQTSQ